MLDSNCNGTVSFGRLLVQTMQGPAVDKKRIQNWIENYRLKSNALIEQDKRQQEKFIRSQRTFYSANKKRIDAFFAHMNSLAEYYIQKTITSIHSFDSMNGDYLLLSRLFQKLFSGAELADLSTDELGRFGDNCYEFATGDAFSSNDMGDLIVNPGFTCANSDVYKRVFKNGVSLLLLNENDWFTLMKNDLNRVGKNIARINGSYTPKPGSILIAAVCAQDDYHFYRYFPEYGFWAHKQGSQPVNALDESGMLIEDVSKCDRGAYARIIGYYEITEQQQKKPVNYLDMLGRK